MRAIIKILITVLIVNQFTYFCFAQLNAVNEGSYNVSPLNGNLNYTYPVSNTTIDGYPVTVKVNYVSNLTFTSFEFHGFTGEHKEINQEYNEDDVWVKMTKTSPAWIIGVNGFAVQVLSQNQRFHSNYAKNDNNSDLNFKLYGDNPLYCKEDETTEFYLMKKDMAYSFKVLNENAPTSCTPNWHSNQLKETEADNIWLIDGYDYCNSLQTPDVKYFQDFIHILREDGSILELRNTAWREGETDDKTFTGLYYENGINTNGFAIVEYDTTKYWPTYIRTKIIENSEYSSGLLKPRIVKYYPGNGLEYVFREYVSPFGTREDLQKIGSCSFNMLPKATIFYLEEMNSSLKNLTKFERDQHKPSQTNIELLRGRAMIKEFANHKFAYSNNEIVIETFGQKYALSLRKKDITESDMEYSFENNCQYYPELNDSIDTKSRRYFNLTNHNGYNNEIEGIAISKDTISELEKYYYADKSNGLYYIDKIIDPIGNIVSFDYDPKIVQITGFTSSAYNLKGSVFYIGNYRMSRISTQKLQTVFNYKSGNNTYSFSSTDTVNLDPDQYSIIDSIEIYDNLENSAHNKISSVDYNIEYYNNSYPEIFRKCIVINRNYILGLTNSSEIFFSDYRARPIRFNQWQNYYSPDMHYPLVMKTISTRDDETVTIENEYQNFYDNVNNLYKSCFIIESQSISSFKKNGNLLKTSKENHFYEFEKLNDFNFNLASLSRGPEGDFSMDSAYNWGIKKHTIARYTSLDNANDYGLIDSTEIFYLNLPFLYNQDNYRYDKNWNKKESDFLNMSNLHFGSSEFGNVFNTCYNTSKINVPPLYGLDTMILVIKNGDTLNGIKKVYEKNFNPGPSAPAHRRGALLRDSILPFNSNEWEFASKYEYNEGWDRNLMNKITDSKGRFINSWYDYYDIPGLDEENPPTGIIMKNNQETEQVEFYQRYYQFERPLASTYNVRNYILDGTLVKLDTTKLNNIFELNNYGLVTGYIDPNGWYYQTNYDGIGRTTVVRHPYDFPSNSSSSSLSISVDECVPITEAQKTQIITTSTSRGSNYMYQQLPPVQTTSFTNLEFGKKLELIGKTDVDSVTTLNRFKITDKTVSLIYQPSQYDIFHRNTTLTNLKLKLLLEVAPNNCSSINIKIPELNYETNVIVGCYPISILNNSCDEEESEYKAPEVIVDLNEVKSYFEDLPLNQTITFVISSGTTGGFMQLADLGQPYSPCLSATANETTNNENDYTYKFVYDNKKNQQLSLAKIDDKVIADYNHTPRKFPNTQNNNFAKTENFSAGRYTGFKRVFGASGLKLRDSLYIGNPYSSERTDVFSNQYNNDRTIVYTEPNSNYSTIQLNEKGSPTEFTNQERNTSKSITEYLMPDDAIITGDALIAGDVMNEEFYGLCIRVIQTNELGIRYIKYIDGLGRLRMSIDDDTTDNGHFRLKTKYLYDDFNQLKSIINPKGDTTFYFYDKYGRVVKKYQIDVDSIKFKYDKSGQLRFSQNKKQLEEHKFSFIEYDDLGRSTIIGEAKIENIDFNSLNPDTLNIGSSIANPYTYTSNPTVWQKNGGSSVFVNSILTGSQTYFAYSGIRDNIPTFNNTLENKYRLIINDLSGKYLMHPANYYPDIALPTANLNINNFEDISNYPQFIKSAVNYDKLPHKAGYIWEKMPDLNDINLLTPFGELRNLKGNQSAIAYRDNEDEPFHYVFFSYDARGRVEAIVRWTENIGFDVVHYTYNSMNQVNTVTAIDGLRQFTTWNVYDDNGRLWKVYSKAGSKGFHNGNDNLIDGTDVSFPEPLEKPDVPDITYTYNQLGAVSLVKYKLLNDSIFKNVTYNSTGKITEISVFKNLTNLLFREVLERNEIGNVIKQTSAHSSSSSKDDNYIYDNLNRITEWSTTNNSATYSYDAVGNFDNNCTRDSYSMTFNYADKNNRNTNMLSYFAVNGRNEQTNFFYNSIGAVDSIYGVNENGITYFEKFNYSNGSILKSITSKRELSAYRNFEFPSNSTPLTFTYDNWTWSYRTGAFSTREQKRLLFSPHSDTTATVVYEGTKTYAHLWNYNLVGAGGEELVQYRGIQMAAPNAADTGRRVYMAPYKYIVPGGEIRILADTNDRELCLTDHLGSVRCVISTNTIVKKDYDYDPFGRYSFPYSPLPEEGFVSEKNDFEEGESNLMQMGVRMYSPQIGRFLAVDPLFEMMPGHNLYHYAFNSPLMWKDPSGLAPEKEKNGEELQSLNYVIIYKQCSPIDPGGYYLVSFIPVSSMAEYNYDAFNWVIGAEEIYNSLGFGGSSSGGAQNGGTTSENSVPAGNGVKQRSNKSNNGAEVLNWLFATQTNVCRAMDQISCLTKENGFEYGALITWSNNKYHVSEIVTDLSMEYIDTEKVLRDDYGYTDDMIKNQIMRVHSHKTDGSPFSFPDLKTASDYVRPNLKYSFVVTPTKIFALEILDRIKAESLDFEIIKDMYEDIKSKAKKSGKSRIQSKRIALKAILKKYEGIFKIYETIDKQKKHFRVMK